MPEDSDNGRKRSAPKADNSKLPLTTVIDDAYERKRAVRLLAEAATLKAAIDKQQARLDEIMDTLCGVAEAYSPTGFRNGNVGLQFSGWTTRKSLSATMLVDAGVDPEVVGACYSDSKPFLQRKIVIFE